MRREKENEEDEQSYGGAEYGEQAGTEPVGQGIMRKAGIDDS